MICGGLVAFWSGVGAGASPSPDHMGQGSSCITVLLWAMGQSCGQGQHLRLGKRAGGAKKVCV